MFSKFKKVLVSLALAASLALAPMNVSADYNGPIKGSASVNPAVNQNGDAVQVPVYLTGTASVTPEYTIEVSPSLTIDLDGPSTSASNLATPPVNATDGIYMKLSAADDFGEYKLQVTPNFSISGTTDKIAFTANGENGTTVNDTNGMTLTALGIGNNLLKFGTYNSTGGLNDGTDSISFLEAEKNGTPKKVSTTVDSAAATSILKNIPDQITDTQDSTKKSVGTPRIAANQQIGNVTFTCEFVAVTQGS